ncbi:hypothetical protein YC2023_000052 [Brassica napus]
MPMNGFVTWSRGGGLVTRVPRREDYDTCSLRASRGKEEGVRSMGLGPNRFTIESNGCDATACHRTYEMRTRGTKQKGPKTYDNTIPDKTKQQRDT